MGSRILSRSFNVEKWEGSGEDEGQEKSVEHDSDENAMEVDPESTEQARGQGEGGEAGQEEVEGEETREEEEEESDDSGDIAMVPMADMLNARYGTENVRPAVLFCNKLNLNTFLLM